MIPRSLIFFFLLIPFSQIVTAQYSKSIYFSDTEIAESDSQKLFLRFESSTFINNKEFFNPYDPGYTLIGYYLRPMFEFNAGVNTRIKAGVHLLKYSGSGKYHQAIPLFSFHHRFSPGLDMVLGSLYGSLNHNLIEPLFAFDRFFTHHNESGLQFLINKKFFKADIWLNWEKFILWGDPFQEEFTAGFSSSLFTSDRLGRFRLEFPVQFLATHSGGQIDTSGERLQTLVNFAGGVNLDMETGNNLIRGVGFRGYLAGFRDLSNELRYPYDNGWGIYPNLIINTKWLEMGIGYWIGHKFVAPRGEHVFQSVSRADPEIADDNRELITSKLIYNRELIKGINMGLRLEVYCDPPGGYFDHSGGLHIIIDERFFITRVKRM